MDLTDFFPFYSFKVPQISQIHTDFYLFTLLPLKVPQAVPSRKTGEGFDAPPTLERSGSEHRRAVTSFPLMVKGKAWLGIKDPPAGEGQVGQKKSLLG